jgi:hypothetical protein
MFRGIQLKYHDFLIIQKPFNKCDQYPIDTIFIRDKINIVLNIFLPVSFVLMLELKLYIVDLNKSSVKIMGELVWYSNFQVFIFA